jgi:hypothetical protein
MEVKNSLHLYVAIIRVITTAHGIAQLNKLWTTLTSWNGLLLIA